MQLLATIYWGRKPQNVRLSELLDFKNACDNVIVDDLEFREDLIWGRHAFENSSFSQGLTSNNSESSHVTMILKTISL